MRHAGQVIDASTIIEHVWGYEGGDNIALKNLVYRLRRKIEPNPKDPQYLQWLEEGYGFFPQPGNS
jgi:DNA-binding response OmpR family regulator